MDSVFSLGGADEQKLADAIKQNAEGANKADAKQDAELVKTPAEALAEDLHANTKADLSKLEDALDKMSAEKVTQLETIANIVKSDPELLKGSVLKQMSDAVLGEEQAAQEDGTIDADLKNVPDTEQDLKAFLGNLSTGTRKTTLAQFYKVGARIEALSKKDAAPAQTAAPAAPAPGEPEVVKTPQLGFSSEELASRQAKGFAFAAEHAKFASQARMFGLNVKAAAKELDSTRITSEGTRNKKTDAASAELNRTIDEALNDFYARVDEAYKTEIISDAGLLRSHRLALNSALERTLLPLTKAAVAIKSTPTRQVEMRLNGQAADLVQLAGDGNSLVEELFTLQAQNSTAYKHAISDVRATVKKQLKSNIQTTKDLSAEAADKQLDGFADKLFANLQKRADGVQIMQGMLSDSKEAKKATTAFFKAYNPHLETQNAKDSAKMTTALTALSEAGRTELEMKAPTAVPVVKKSRSSLATQAGEAGISDEAKFAEFMQKFARARLAIGATDEAVKQAAAAELNKLQSTPDGANVIKAIMMAAQGDKDALKAFNTSCSFTSAQTRDEGVTKLAGIGKGASIKAQKAEARAQNAAKTLEVTDDMLKAVEGNYSFGIDHLTGTAAPKSLDDATTEYSETLGSLEQAKDILSGTYKRHLSKKDAARLNDLMDTHIKGLKSLSNDAKDLVNNTSALEANRENQAMVLSNLLKEMNGADAAVRKSIMKQANANKDGQTSEISEKLQADLKAIDTVPAVSKVMKEAQGEYLESLMLANPEFKAKSDKLTAQLAQTYENQGDKTDIAKAKAAKLMSDIAKYPDAMKLANRLETGIDNNRDEASAIVEAYKADDITPAKRWAAVQALSGQFKAPKVTLKSKIGTVLSAAPIGAATTGGNLRWALYAAAGIASRIPVTGLASFAIGAGVGIGGSIGIKMAGTSLAGTILGGAIATAGLPIAVALGVTAGMFTAGFAHHFNDLQSKNQGVLKSAGKAIGLGVSEIGKKDNWKNVLKAHKIVWNEMPKAYGQMRAQEGVNGKPFKFLGSKALGATFKTLSLYNQKLENRMALNVITGGLGSGAGYLFGLLNPDAAVATAKSGVAAVQNPVDTATNLGQAAKEAGAGAIDKASSVLAPIVPNEVKDLWNSIFEKQTFVRSALDGADPRFSPDGVEYVSTPQSVEGALKNNPPLAPIAPPTSAELGGAKPTTPTDPSLRRVAEAQQRGAARPQGTTPQSARTGTGTQPQTARSGVPVATPLPSTPDGIAAAIQKGFPTQAGAVTVQPNGDITTVFPSTEKANLAAQKMMAGRGMFKVPHSITIMETGQMVIKPNLAGAQNDMVMRNGTPPAPLSTYAEANGGRALAAAETKVKLDYVQNGKATIIYGPDGKMIEPMNVAKNFSDTPQSLTGNASKSAFTNASLGGQQEVTVYYTGQQPGLQPLPASKFIPNG